MFDYQSDRHCSKTNLLGFNIEFIKETSERKMPDAFLNGVEWEFKVPERYNEKTVKNQFKKAIGKGTSKMVLTNIKNHAPIAEMVQDAKAILRSSEFTEIDEVLIIGEDMSIKRLTRIKGAA